LQQTKAGRRSQSLENGAFGKHRPLVAVGVKKRFLTGLHRGLHNRSRDGALTPFDISTLPPISQPTQDRRKYIVVTEELESSLRQTIETYLGDRLRAIDEQISRLQSEFNDALARLRESSANESLDATPVSAAIAAHLQAAREQKLSGVSAPESTPPPPDISAIKRAVAQIEKQHTHADVLRVLLTSAVQFADRVAIFVIKNEQAMGWQECERGDATNLESIRGVALPLSAETLLGRAISSGSVWSGGSGRNTEDQLLVDQLGGEPKSLAAVPLTVRGKVVAVLYADAASSDPTAINLDAIELLSRVAAMAINLAAAASTAPAKREHEPAAAPVSAEVETPAAVSETPSGYQPHVEPAAHEVFAQPVVEETVAEPGAKESVAEPITEEAAESKIEEAAATPVVEYAPQPIVEEAKAEPEEKFSSAHEERVEVESPPTHAPIETESSPPTAVPSFASNYAAPLGAARRYGVTEPDLPIEVGEEERRLHNDARRFARLLVSEIKLYNEQKVTEGRSRNNLYERLREDIDRSRQMYDKRVAPPVAARHDYFHQELVNTLAEGDTSKLGAGYPGASLAMN